MLKIKAFVIFLLGLYYLPLMGCNSELLPEITIPDEVKQQTLDVVAEAAEAVSTAQEMGLVEISGFDMSALEESLAAVQPDENGDVNITISEDDVNEAIAAKEAADTQAGNRVIIRNMALSFGDGRILLTADVTAPVPTQLEVAFQPVVNDGVLQFDVVEASIGVVQVTEALLGTTESILNNSLGKAIAALPTNVVLQDVVVGDNELAIVGKAN